MSRALHRSVAILIAMLVPHAGTLSGQVTGGQASHSQQPGTLLASLSQQADLSSTDAGLHVFCQTLAEVLTGAPPDDPYGDIVSSRLYMSQRMTLDGKRHLIKEDVVARAFNLLMAKTTPRNAPAITASAQQVHDMRLFLSRAAPQLTSVDAHAASCYPTEAVLLLKLLLSAHDPLPGGSPKPGTIIAGIVASGATYYLNRYVQTYSHFAMVRLYDSIIGTLGF